MSSNTQVHYVNVACIVDGGIRGNLPGAVRFGADCDFCSVVLCKRQWAACTSMLIRFTEFSSGPSVFVVKSLSSLLLMYAIRDASTLHFSSPTICPCLKKTPGPE